MDCGSVAKSSRAEEGLMFGVPVNKEQANTDADDNAAASVQVLTRP